MKAHNDHVVFLGRLIVSHEGALVVCRHCKTGTLPLSATLAKALASAVLVPARGGALCP